MLNITKKNTQEKNKHITVKPSTHFRIKMIIRDNQYKSYDVFINKLIDTWEHVKLGGYL
jgi:hypothetical protein